MATFNDDELWLDGTVGSRAGAVLQLASAPEDDLRAAVAGAEVLARRGSKALVVRGMGERSFGDGLRLAFGDGLRLAVEVANRGLDIMASGGRATLSLLDVQRENIVWVEKNSHVDLRIWAVMPWPMPRLRVQMQVKDTEGNVVTQAPEPDPAWHEAFRYFRLAQITDDLFDAFRNLYLALEALLSTIAPQRLSPGGRPNEPEGQWFHRALTAASQRLDMHRYAAKGQGEATVDALYEEIYRRTRTAVFHAKAGRPVLIPLDLPSRPAVLDTLQRLAQIVVDLSEQVTGVRFASSSWSSIAFRSGAEAILKDPTVYLSDGEHQDIDAQSVNDLAGQRIGAPGHRAADHNESFRSVVVGEFAAADISRDLPFVASAIVANSEDQPMLASTLEGRLRVDGVDRVEVALGVRGINTRMLRSDYAS